MKDLQRLVAYVGIPLGIIVLLVSMVGEGISDGTVGVIAVLAVVVLPVIIGILMAKNERKKAEDSSSGK